MPRCKNMSGQQKCWESYEVDYSTPSLKPTFGAKKKEKQILSVSKRHQVESHIEWFSAGLGKIGQYSISFGNIE